MVSVYICWRIANSRSRAKGIHHGRRERAKGEELLVGNDTGALRLGQDEY